ncbi:hypothetical protein AK812_SmicGene44479 [Symbiodinium microadriaticum]|uniref:Uncharacterized protein n=1 Tax=Symbiodinium microadriaticum TaxID=2951 RepID=A0A1Q9BYC6_SYMMI|nr:hypothetical protein AK812_SmicGene44479 [Symbiodinium microadriaticum]
MKREVRAPDTEEAVGEGAEGDTPEASGDLCRALQSLTLFFTQIRLAAQSAASSTHTVEGRDAGTAVAAEASAGEPPANVAAT